jgi:hypothetical protein
MTEQVTLQFKLRCDKQSTYRSFKFKIPEATMRESDNKKAMIILQED